jgi:putative transposase
LWYDFDAQMLQQALADLRRAYINFFERRDRVPKFKKKKAARQSFRIQRFGLRTDGSMRRLYAGECVTRISTR